MHLHFWRYLDITPGSTCRVYSFGPARCATCGLIHWFPYAAGVLD